MSPALVLPRPLFAALTLLLAGSVLAPSPAAAAAPTTSGYDVISGSGFSAGTASGTKVTDGRLVIDGSAPTRATWTSAWVRPTTTFRELIPSWRAATPAGTWIEIAARARTAGGRTSSFDTVARWSSREDVTRRTSFSAQTDDLAKVNTDTVVAQGVTFAEWQVRVTLVRKSGSGVVGLSRVGAVATLPGATPGTSKPLYSAAAQLAVPSYSQMVHKGEYDQYGGGGEAWCSPTSTSMVLGYYHRLPPASAYTWVKGSYADRWVDYAARSTYDVGYQGTGNWPFNTAYANQLVGDAFVTRLGDLRDAERFVHAGIPLVASISFARGQLSGAPISASNGHLLVISGFTKSGDVVVNDPAAASNAGVRRTYARGQFERAWLTKSLGTVYVIRDAAHPLPARTSRHAW